MKVAKCISISIVHCIFIFIFIVPVSLEKLHKILANSYCSDHHGIKHVKITRGLHYVLCYFIVLDH